MRLSRTTLALIGLLMYPVAAPAQSLFATRGLGMPVPATDARARALGGIGVGLLGLNTSLVNPAEMAGAASRGVSAALQPLVGSAEANGVNGDLAATRFPLLRVIYPVGERLVASVGYGGFLEQSWAVSRTGTETVGDEELTTRDVVQSIGGVAQATVGFAYTATPWLSLGVAAGLYTGTLERRVSRTFVDSTQIQPFETRLRWSYGGPVAIVGFRLDPSPIVRVGGSIAISDELKVDGEAGGARSDRARLPMKITGGASGWLSPDLLLSAGVEWAGRGGEQPAFEDVSESLRRSTYRVGGGFEYEGLTSGRRAYPIRIGASYAQLPYFNEGEDPGHEWSGSFGLGLRLAGDASNPLAVIDATVERGGRSGLAGDVNPDGLSESFWRFTFSLSLFGR